MKIMDQIVVTSYVPFDDRRTPALLNISSRLQSGNKFMHVFLVGQPVMSLVPGPTTGPCDNIIHWEKVPLMEF